MGDDARVAGVASHQADTIPTPHFGPDSFGPILAGDSKGGFSSDTTRCTKGLPIWLSTRRKVRGYES